MAKSSGRIIRFLKEVRRRRVHQTVGAYIVAAVMAMEAADLVLPTMSAPDWTFDLLVVFLIFMFPVVVVFSWVFDLTRTGLVRTTEETPRPVSRSSRPRLTTMTTRTPMPSAWFQTGSANETITSLAILPFSNSGDEPEGGYVSDGITEAIINKMSRLSGLRVIPRATAFRHRSMDRDITEIGEELGVRAVVTGSVYHRGEQLVVQAELVDVQRLAQLWGEHYAGPWSDVFTVQNEIASKISESLRLELSREEKKSLRKRETEYPEAYQDYLRGRFHWNRRTAEGFRQATSYFRAAIGRDPEYAAAYTGLSDTYNVLGYYGMQAPRDSYPPGKVAAEKALAIDPDLAEAHASLGYNTLFYERDWEGAKRHFERAIALDPKYASAHQWYGWYLLVMERFDDCVRSMEKALELDPLSLVINDHLAYGYILAGRMAEAKSQIERARGLDPNYPLALWRLGDWQFINGEWDEAVRAYFAAAEITDGRLTLGHLGLTYGMMGREDDARGVLARLDRDAKGRYVSALDRALVHAGLGELDATFSRLWEAAEDRASDMVRVKLLPWPDAVLADPRFAELIRALDLPPGITR